MNKQDIKDIEKICDKVIDEIKGDEMISKELFKEVMNYDGSYKDYNTEQIMGDSYPLDIHNLIQRCRLWAWEQGYGFEVLPFAINIFDRTTCTNVKEICSELNKIPYKIEDTLKACQYIMEQTK